MAHNPIWSRSNDDNEEEGDNFGYNLKFDLNERFLSDMLKMFREGSYNDVCIKLHDGEIKANKSVLAARCDYFAATFRWKENNNHEVEKIVITDCSKKIMTRIIEYIFTGVLQTKDLKFLDFIELKDQVRKMFPGDELEGQIEDILKDEDNDYYLSNSSLNILPTNEEVVKALSRVENGNLQSAVMAELAREIERSTIIITGDPKQLEKAITLSNLFSLGVIESVQHLDLELNPGISSLDLGSLSGNHLLTLVSCVTESITIRDVTNYDVTTLIESVRCKELILSGKKLNQEETEALVRAMTTRVEIVQLDMDAVGLDYSVSLDFDTFTNYTGDGICRLVSFNHTCIKWSDDESDDTDDDWGDMIARRASWQTKHKWLDATSAQAWAEKMNWDLHDDTGFRGYAYGLYLLSRKKHD